MTMPDADTAGIISPIFLFSLPRSGSTLTQRVLATHQKIETAAEPWVLLPFLYARIQHGVYAAYSHTQATKGIDDFCAGLPHGSDDYSAELRKFVLGLYARRAGPTAKYFLDKTPRYHLVVDEIADLFPDARLIFLWRNPLAVIASMIETFGKGRWNLYRFDVDLFDGIDKLICAYGIYQNRSCSVTYEELVGSVEPWKRVFKYLDLEFDELQLGTFSGVSLPGRMGDPTGQKAYKSFSTEPLEKWKSVLANPVRKLWCRRYLRWIGEDRLKLMGYDLNALMTDLGTVPTSYRLIFSDISRMLFGMAFRVFEPLMALDKYLRLRAHKRLYSHT